MSTPTHCKESSITVTDEVLAALVPADFAVLYTIALCNSKNFPKKVSWWPHFLKIIFDEWVTPV